MIRELTTYEFTCDACKVVVKEQQVKMGGPTLPAGWTYEDVHGCVMTGYTRQDVKCPACKPGWALQSGATVRRKGFGARTKGVVTSMTSGDLEMPVQVRFEDGSESKFRASALERAEYECPSGHDKVERLQNEIDGKRIHEALRCHSCKANYVQILGGRWLIAPN